RRFRRIPPQPHPRNWTLPPTKAPWYGPSLRSSPLGRGLHAGELVVLAPGGELVGAGRLVAHQPHPPEVDEADFGREEVPLLCQCPSRVHCGTVYGVEAVLLLPQTSRPGASLD